MANQAAMPLECMYRQGIELYQRGEWQAALDMLRQLEAYSGDFHGIDDLICDARLRQQLISAGLPGAIPPPQRGRITRVALTVALLALLGQTVALMVF